MACRIGVVATGSRGDPTVAADVQALAERLFPGRAPEILFHPNSALVSGHFAGDDAARAQAFLDVANDPGFDALWVARGGYGACRLIEKVLPELKPAAREKAYLGYSDAGSLLGALYGQGFEHLAHGPMVQDIRRKGGEAAVARALSWLVDRSPEALEPSLAEDARPAVAFNLTILAHLVGTPWLPDLDGHVLMVEEVSEYMYRIDRDLFQVTSSPALRRIAGLRLGRCSDIVPNDPDFGLDEVEVARSWCSRAGIAYLGRADVGHDIDNKVVPFGPRG
ncbi:MAG: LD-carboxypeptidase [Proteobacteria bacterium]|nr:LD-carboxypeptidase [Pseudomonadota bacterium]